jgi:hypothetical protein
VVVGGVEKITVIVRSINDLSVFMTHGQHYLNFHLSVRMKMNQTIACLNTAGTCTF